MTLSAVAPSRADRRVRADVATWQALRFYVRLADSVLEQHQPNHPVRQSFPDLIDLLNSEISLARNGTVENARCLEDLDLIDSAASAAILGLSQRRVQQIAGALGGRKVNGIYVFHRAAVTAYAGRLRNE